MRGPYSCHRFSSPSFLEPVRIQTEIAQQLTKDCATVIWKVHVGREKASKRFHYREIGNCICTTIVGWVSGACLDESRYVSGRVVGCAWDKRRGGLSFTSIESYSG